MLPKDGFVIWPAYFDRNISKSEGRRVPKKLAVSSPKAKEIFEASKKLGFEARIEKGAYPRRWWLKEGKVIVKAEGITKAELIKKIAIELFNMRTSSKS